MVGAFKLEIVDLLRYRHGECAKECRPAGKAQGNLHGNDRLPNARVRGEHGRSLRIEEIVNEDGKFEGEIGEIVREGLTSSRDEGHEEIGRASCRERV